MKIRETRGNFGTLFAVESGHSKDFHDITKWLRENDIQFLVTYPRRDGDDCNYFVLNEVSIMAFKLRWI